MTLTRLAILLLAALFALALVPSTSAHTTVETEDGRFFITVGNQNEPIMTFTKTGLDLTVRENASGERGDPVPDLHRTLTVTITSPGGDEMSMDLKTQFGSEGSYEFVEPYVLTEPGEYFAQVTGEIDGSQVDERILVGSGPIPAYDELSFPDDVQTLVELEAQIAALQDRIDQLETEMQHLEEDAHADGSTDAGEAAGPGPLALGLVVLAALLVTRRHRA